MLDEVEHVLICFAKDDPFVSSFHFTTNTLRKAKCGRFKSVTEILGKIQYLKIFWPKSKSKQGDRSGCPHDFFDCRHALRAFLSREVKSFRSDAQILYFSVSRK